MLARLIEQQRKLGMTDRAFAGLLGIPRSTWTLTRLGKIKLSRRLVAAAGRTFPELMPDAIAFLLSDVRLLTYLVSDSTKEQSNDS
jgi:hypothetical protein